ncbi:MAG: hypothetical protein QG567_1666 [Campylobacterota bacterium]|nr:hypothetical protein [Campylobacterota bacterium]
MNEKKWIKSKYYYSELNNSKINSILYFGLIWSIFEDEVCVNNAKISKSKNLSLLLCPSLEHSSKRKITTIWNYFVDRYVDVNGDINHIFQNFKFNLNDDKPFVENALKKRKKVSFEEKIEAILRIVFRLRNNLLHGEKDVLQLYGQNKNFQNANKFLILIIEKQIKIN